MTVEEIDASAIDAAFNELVCKGLPAVRGEVVEGDVAGYHYYPGRDQVLLWFAAEQLDILDEDFKRDNGWGYRHFLLRDRPLERPAHVLDTGAHAAAQTG
jgi:hypothetical protein